MKEGQKELMKLKKKKLTRIILLYKEVVYELLKSNLEREYARNNFSKRS